MADLGFPSSLNWRIYTRFVPADQPCDMGNYAAGSRLLHVEYFESTARPFWRLLIAVPYG